MFRHGGLFVPAGGRGLAGGFVTTLGAGVDGSLVALPGVLCRNRRSPQSGVLGMPWHGATSRCLRTPEGLPEPARQERRVRLCRQERRVLVRFVLLA